VNAGYKEGRGATVRMAGTVKWWAGLEGAKLERSGWKKKGQRCGKTGDQRRRERERRSRMHEVEER
jgi:hypothetical protein